MRFVKEQLTSDSGLYSLISGLICKRIISRETSGHFYCQEGAWCLGACVLHTAGVFGGVRVSEQRVFGSITHLL